MKVIDNRKSEETKVNENAIAECWNDRDSVHTFGMICKDTHNKDAGFNFGVFNNVDIDNTNIMLSYWKTSPEAVIKALKRIYDHVRIVTDPVYLCIDKPEVDSECH